MSLSTGTCNCAGNFTCWFGQVLTGRSLFQVLGTEYGTREAETLSTWTYPLRHVFMHISYRACTNHTPRVLDRQVPICPNAHRCSNVRNLSQSAYKCRCALRVGHTSQARLPGLPTPPQLRLRYSPIPLPRYSTKRHVCGQPLRKTLPSWRSLGRWGRRAGSGPSSELWELVGHGVVLFYSVSASRSSLLP